MPSLKKCTVVYLITHFFHYILHWNCFSSCTCTQDKELHIIMLSCEIHCIVIWHFTASSALGVIYWTCSCMFSPDSASRNVPWHHAGKNAFHLYIGCGNASHSPICLFSIFPQCYRKHRHQLPRNAQDPWAGFTSKFHTRTIGSMWYLLYVSECMVVQYDFDYSLVSLSFTDIELLQFL